MNKKIVFNTASNNLAVERGNDARTLNWTFRNFDGEQDVISFLHDYISSRSRCFVRNIDAVPLDVPFKRVAHLDCAKHRYDKKHRNQSSALNVEQVCQEAVVLFEAETTDMR